MGLNILNKKQNMLRIFLLINLGLMILLLVSCTNRTEFSSKLKNEFEKGPGTIVKISDTTGFSWDKLFVYAPYHPLDEINKKHKISLKGRDYWINRSYVSEGDCLYIFESNGETIEATYYPRRKGSCLGILEVDFYTPDTAIFEVQGKGSNLYLEERAQNAP